jgi:hypothetical protein
MNAAAAQKSGVFHDGTQCPDEAWRVLRQQKNGPHCDPFQTRQRCASIQGAPAAFAGAAPPAGLPPICRAKKFSISV